MASRNSNPNRRWALVGVAGGLVLSAGAAASVTILSPITSSSVASGSSATIIDLTGRYDDTNLTGTIARFSGEIGSFNVELFNVTGPGRVRATPLTVANFVNYINQGRYVNDLVHRTVSNFVLQGGGYTGAALPALFTNVTTNAAVLNEPGNTNARGTIAMARIGGQVNSATSQWYINLVNNGVPLDTVDQGFTVFGRVLGDGMNVVDAIAAIPRFAFGAPFGEVPLRGFTQADFDSGRAVYTQNLVTFSSIETIGELSYTCTSSNSALVRPEIVGNKLVLNYGLGMTGIAGLTLRVTSADGGFVLNQFEVAVTNTAASAGLAVSPARVAPGGTITLTPAGSAFANPSVTRVEFYRDLNGNGVLEASETTAGLIGTDTTPGDGFSLAATVQGAAFNGAAGGQIYFAQGYNGTAVVPGTLVVAAGSINRTPTIGLFARHEQNFASTSDIVTNAGDNLEMAALNVVDRDGTVASVEFFRDANGNNVFDAGVDVSLGVDSTPADGFGFIASTTGFVTGVTTSVFARATDSEGLTGPAVGLTLRVNAAPTVGSVEFTGPVILRGLPVTVRALNVADVDSPLAGTPATRVNKVEFYRDANGNGTLEPSVDQVLGSVTVGAGGTYSLPLTGVQTAAFPGGANRFFVRATDNDLGVGAAVSGTIVVTYPVDVNGDGEINADDLGDFITGYFSTPPDPATDFNGDGVINADDLGDYITAYFAT